ncbi:MAG: S46 family peptidase [Labilithrix sp.]|nr:S46 family peptidase [Labilithrix sp.]MCW5816196.1 S46 family peptidase [Labilithrix sp.]
MRNGLRIVAIASVVSLGVFACGEDTPPPKAPPPPPPPVTVATTPPPAPPPYVAPAPRFENPGGMWMPHQIKEHGAKLKELGLQLDPNELSDPTSGVLSAIVSLGGCSASFISADGLIATNHHCATAALQHNSTPSSNLLKDGFLAKTRADEKNNGPEARVFVTRAVTDITPKVRDGLEKIADDKARHREIEKRQKEIVAACEKDKKGARCAATSFYEGSSYFLIEQLEIKDVRLVWAPPAGVGNFGGEIDNWRWPRHTGDVSMFRAYVGKDGQPADYSNDNVPYKPPHFLKPASSPLREGDLVFVAGYPGRTYTLKTKAEVDEAIQYTYPRRQKYFEDYLARLGEATKDDKEAQIRANSYVRRFGNFLTNTKGQLEGLVKGGLAEQRAKSEKELRAFIDADAKNKAAWGKAMDDIAAEVKKGEAWREKDAQFGELELPKLVASALTIVRMAEERAKPDAQRDPAYQQRNWTRIEQQTKSVTTGYNRKVDEALLGLALERIAKQPEADRTPAFKEVLALGGGSAKDTSPEALKKVVGALYETTTLGDEAARVELVKSGTTAKLQASKDPLVKLALKLRPIQKASKDRGDAYAGKMALLRPKYIEALKAFKKDAPFAPDANSTLRVTYGTVRGYKPSPTAEQFRPFTMLSQVVAKDQKKDPFDVPAPVIEFFKAMKVGPYADETLNGEVPVDFLADLHITGGNSGSATLNAKGEICGLVFDGNYEAMASDWVFTPSLTRSIHTDIRYVEWLLDGPFAGDHVLQEMGVTPKL